MKEENSLPHSHVSKRKLVGLGIAAGIILTGLGTTAFYMKHKVSEVIVDKIQQNTSELDLLKYAWNYMPGMVHSKNGFLINPTQLAIVTQDGLPSQPNPPINLAGLHLENVKGDFGISARLDPQNSKTATIQLYGKVPLIADEFRLERESVRMTIAKDKLVVSVWDGSGQNAIIQKEFTITPEKTVILTMKRQNEMLSFTVNDKLVGSVNESGIFRSGQVWFGFDGNGSEWLLSDLHSQKLTGGSFEIADSSKINNMKHDPNGLQNLASKKRPGFLVGTALALGPVVSDSQYANRALDKNMFGSITPENQMKMINLEPQKGVFTFEQADALVQLAKQNGIKVHGHTLVFGEANPPWFNNLPVKTNTDKKQIEQIMQTHITTVVKHFGKDINSWDVVNEPLADYDDFDMSSGKILRNHKWYQAMGESYIINAIETAHKANPNAMLFINEYGLEADGERFDAFIGLLNRLKPQLIKRGIPISKIGIGFQSHVYASEDRIDPATLKRHIQQLGKLGFVMQISEMDVYSDDGDAVQAKQYADIFQTCLNEKNCIAWRAWILSDRYNLYKDDNGKIQYGVDGLFDTNMKPRPGFTQIQTLLLK